MLHAKLLELAIVVAAVHDSTNVTTNTASSQLSFIGFRELEIGLPFQILGKNIPVHIERWRESKACDICICWNAYEHIKNMLVVSSGMLST